MFKKFSVLLSALLMSIFVTATCFANTWTAENPVYNDSNYFVATGMGYPNDEALLIGDEDFSRAIAYEAAVCEAYAHLAETINGAKVTSETNVQNLRLQNKVTNTRTEAIIKNAEVVSVEYKGVLCKITVRVPKFGSNSIASAVIPQNSQTETLPTTPLVSVSIPSEGYTGLIIDCRGLTVSPAMCPMIKTNNGQKIYGYQQVPHDIIINQGIVSYCKENMPLTRAGNHPLVIHATSMLDHNVNAIVSDEDASKIIMANNISHFLNNCNVIFLRD